VNQRVRGQARWVLTDTVRRRVGASLDINDDDFAVCGNEYRHIECVVS
jgi:hypothetical protein